MNDIKNTESEDILDFPEKVSTGNGYSNDLIATSNDRLGRTIRATILLSKTFETESKHIRGTIRELNATIKDLDKKNSKLQLAIAWLTVVTVVTALIQIIIAVKSIKS